MQLIKSLKWNHSVYVICSMKADQTKALLCLIKEILH